MAELAVKTKEMDFHLEQVQDFTPTPMTVSTEAWYTGYDPYTLEPVFSAKTPKEKLAQRMFFFWYKPEERKPIEQELRRIGRADVWFPSSSHALRAKALRRRKQEERQARLWTRERLALQERRRCTQEGISCTQHERYSLQDRCHLHAQGWQQKLQGCRHTKQKQPFLVQS